MTPNELKRKRFHIRVDPSELICARHNTIKLRDRSIKTQNGREDQDAFQAAPVGYSKVASDCGFIEIE